MTSTHHDPAFILQVLDDCSSAFTFPMLDNGYVYLAASRLSLHRSADDWAIVIEVFGFSPRSGIPDIHIHTFGSRLHNRDKANRANNPNNESHFLNPIEEGAWMDEDEPETVSPAGTVTLRERSINLPSVEEYQEAGIELQGERPAIFELCRYLAHHYRDQVLATPSERRVNVPPDLTEILVLEDWHHPDLCNGELPSETETFRELAEVLATGDLIRYRSAEPHNTHWSHWPEGGTL